MFRNPTLVFSILLLLSSCAKKNVHYGCGVGLPKCKENAPPTSHGFPIVSLNIVKKQGFVYFEKNCSYVIFLNDSTLTEGGIDSVLMNTKFKRKHTQVFNFYQTFDILYWMRRQFLNNTFCNNWDKNIEFEKLDKIKHRKVFGRKETNIIPFNEDITELVIDDGGERKKVYSFLVCKPDSLTNH
jgi:hypothetical protein